MRVLRFRVEPGSLGPFAPRTTWLPFLLLFTSTVAATVASAPDDVNHGENNHPNGIHKMPVHGKHSDTAGLIDPDAAS